jgi:predicted AAA+ superfamily ATPase
MQYYREISQKLLSLARQSPCLVLTGARQTGKTTLLKTLFPDYNYITLDLPSLAEQAERDPESFLKENPIKTIIDEAQYAPGLFRHLKHTIDQNRELKAQYILTGSQKFNLMKEVSDSLAGRIIWLELEGLSLYEISQQLKQEVNLELILKYIFQGGLPELWKEPNLSISDYQRSYLATYLERDVRQILNVSSLRDFERFIRLCAIRNGNLLNKSEIAKDVGITVNTVNQWLGILEASNQITLLEPYFSNTGKRVIKSPKIYFNDNGLLAYLLGITPENLTKSPFLGNFWESLVYSELRKKIKNKLSASNLWFYQDNRQREIDFLLEDNSLLNLIEVKWTETPDDNDTQNLTTIFHEMSANSRNFLYQMGKQVVICRTAHNYKNESGILFSNLKYIFEL